jgi:hypothetical protein
MLGEDELTLNGEGRDDALANQFTSLEKSHPTHANPTEFIYPTFPFPASPPNISYIILSCACRRLYCIRIALLIFCQTLLQRDQKA